MYFFKDTNGNWIIGESVDSIVSKVPCELRKSSPTTVAVRTVESRILLLAPIEVTALRKNAAGDFYANYAEFVAAVSDFFDNAPITAEEVDAKIGAEVDILSDRIDTVENIANASTGGSLGSIKPTDPAPTPARNGNYTFSIGGAKPAWLTAEAGITTVKAGDGVAVVYAEPSSYTYTHVDVSSDFVTEQKLNPYKRVRSAADSAIGVATAKTEITSVSANTILLANGTTEALNGYKTTVLLENTGTAGYKYYQADFQVFSEGYAANCVIYSSGVLIEARIYHGVCIVAVPVGFSVKLCVPTATPIYEVTKKKSLDSFYSDYLANPVFKTDYNKYRRIVGANDASTKIATTKTTFIDFVADKILNADGTTSTFSGYKTSNFIENTNNSYRLIQCDFAVFAEQYANVCFYDTSGVLVDSRLYSGVTIVRIPKYYKIKVCVASSKTINEVTGSIDVDTFYTNVFGTSQSVLILGTSIPEGSPYLNNALAKLGHTYFNKALGSSGIVLNSGFLNNGRDGKDLCETIAEKETRYRAKVTDGTITEATLTTWKTYGFETLVLPYINGTLASCKTILFDHGYNDRTKIYSELAGLNSIDWNPDVNADRTTFSGAFKYLLYKIYEVDPTIRVIISGYHEDQSDNTVRGGAGIRQMHEAISNKLGLPYLDVASRLGFNFKFVPNSSNYLSNLNSQYGTSFTKAWQDGSGNITFYQMYNPDSVHPYTDPTGKTNKLLDRIYTNLLKNVL